MQTFTFFPLVSFPFHPFVLNILCALDGPTRTFHTDHLSMYMLCSSHFISRVACFSFQSPSSFLIPQNMVPTVLFLLLFISHSQEVISSTTSDFHTFSTSENTPLTHSNMHAHKKLLGKIISSSITSITLINPFFLSYCFLMSFSYVLLLYS